MDNNRVEIIIYTDGACSGNPGPGGWAYIIRHVPTNKMDGKSGAERHTTNNQMELKAVIEGLKRLKQRDADKPPWKVKVITDSAYVKNGITSWITNWKKNGWRRKTTKGYEPVKNQELWQELDQLVNRHDVSFEWVQGHSGHLENEQCDQMAVQAYRNLMQQQHQTV